MMKFRAQARHVLPVVTLVCGVLANPAPAQFGQQGPKLVGTGTIGDAQQGIALSLSGDGSTGIVGGSSDNSGTGAAWVYTRSGGVWSQQAKLVGIDATDPSRREQGFSVSLSADGNTALVGAPGDNLNIGAARIYTRTEGVWSQQGAKLVGTGAIGTAKQGFSVSLSGDGNTAIIGGTFDGGALGAAWVYTRSGGVWSQQAKLVGTGALGDAKQGQSVSLSCDGNTAIVGGLAGDAAWVFTRSNGVWSQQGPKLVGTGEVGFAQQGSSVSVSGDGNTAIVGGFSDNGGLGATWVFTRSQGVWSQQGPKLVGTGAVGSARQGSSVSLSGDGNIAIVGGWGDNPSPPLNPVGAAWVFTRWDGVWSQLQAKLVGTSAIGNALQGYSVSLSDDGNYAMLGGPSDNRDVESGRTAGAAWVFVKYGRTPRAASCLAQSVFNRWSSMIATRSPPQ
jgi:FG-GAP repeat